MGSEPEDIEAAMLEWISSPNKKSLQRAEVRMTARTMGYDESAIDSGLTAKQLMEIHGNLELMGGDASKALKDPNTFRLIRQHGPEKGINIVYKDAIQDAFGLPDNALDGRLPRQLMDQVADIQLQGLDRFKGRADFWDDINKLSPEALRQRWAGDGPPIPPNAPPVVKPKQPKVSHETAKKIKRKRIVMEPIVVTGRIFDHDEVMVWFDDQKRRPMLVARYFTDGSFEILVSDGQGGLLACEEGYAPMIPGSKHAQPMRRIVRPGATKKNPNGSCVRHPGVARY